MSIKPIIKWCGGKSREINKILPHIPQHFSTYIEPFVGGGALFFYLNRLDKKNIINDVHPELINFYRQIKKEKGKLIYELMEKYKNDEKTYYSIRDNNIDEKKYTKKVIDAFRFFYLRKTCFRGMLRYNSKGKFNIPFGRYKTYNFEELQNPRYNKLLQNTDIYNTDFSDIFKKYGDNPDNFIFLDPPYDSSFTDYGYCKFGKNEHIKLSQCFKKSKAKCMMIIGKTPLITELYEGYIVDTYNKNYNFKIYKNRVNESNIHLVIKNY